MALVGVSTTFYGFGGIGIVEKAEKLSEVFSAAKLPPLIQLGPAVPCGSFSDVAAELNELRAASGVEYSIHQSMWLPAAEFYLNLASSKPQIREASVDSIRKSLDLARAVGAKLVSFHAGYAADEMTQEEGMGPLKPAGKVPYGEAYKNAGTGIGKLLGSAGNIRLSIENLNFRPESRYLFSSPEDFLRLQKGVGVLFDVGHAYFSQIRTGDVDYIHKLIDATAGRITEVHISDNDGSEDQHMLPGRGKVPIKDILEEIAEKQELPPLIIEASRKIHGYSEEDLKKSIIELSGMR